MKFIRIGMPEFKNAVSVFTVYGKQFMSDFHCAVQQLLSQFVCLRSDIHFAAAASVIHSVSMFRIEFIFPESQFLPIYIFMGLI